MTIQIYQSTTFIDEKLNIIFFSSSQINSEHVIVFRIKKSKDE